MAKVGITFHKSVCWFFGIFGEKTPNNLGSNVNLKPRHPGSKVCHFILHTSTRVPTVGWSGLYNFLENARCTPYLMHFLPWSRWAHQNLHFLKNGTPCIWDQIITCVGKESKCENYVKRCLKRCEMFIGFQIWAQNSNPKTFDPFSPKNCRKWQSTWFSLFSTVFAHNVVKCCLIWILRPDLEFSHHFASLSKYPIWFDFQILICWSPML